MTTFSSGRTLRSAQKFILALAAGLVGLVVTLTAGAIADDAIAAAAPAPTATQLNNSLGTVLNPRSSDAQRAAELQGGYSLAPLAKTAAGTYSYWHAKAGWSFRVTGPVRVSGNTATANLVTSLPGYPDQVHAASWIYVNGKWRISNSTVCNVGAYYLGQKCPA